MRSRLEKSGFNPKDYDDILSYSDYIERVYKNQGLTPKQATDIATTLWSNNGGADKTAKKARTAAKGGSVH